MSVGCRDLNVYEVTSHWRALGLETPEQVRYEVLSGLEAETDSLYRLHLAACPGCRALQASLQRLSAAASPGNGSAPVTLAVCPTAETLQRHHYGETTEAENQAVEAHLKKCAQCPVEMRWLALTQETDTSRMLKRRWYFPVAAAVFIASIFVTRHLNESVPKQASYADLATLPALDSGDLLSNARAEERPLLSNAIQQYNAGHYNVAEQRARELTNTGDDPSAELVLAMALYRRGDNRQAYASMLDCEHASPMSAYRCWTTLQMALLMGDKNVAERECRHLADTAEYGQKAAATEKALKNRG